MATLNSLMKHLRAKGIDISGSSQKRKLKNIGYYHGYKGYRFFNQANRPLPINSFDEIVFINEIDMRLKTLLYPQLIFIETALKNYTLEAILKESPSEQMEDIWATCLTGYREETGREYRDAWDKRLRLRNEIDNAIYYNHKNRDIIKHFWMNDKPIPVWAIFEVLTLGNFGNFFSCLKSTVKWNVASDLGMPSNLDSPKILTSIIFTLKDLRNAVAHNGVVFDVRFKQATVSTSIGKLLKNEMSIGGIDFSSITDYILLIVYLMTCMHCSKTDCKKFIASYSNIIDDCYKDLPYNCYTVIIRSDARKKLQSATEFIQKL